MVSFKNCFSSQIKPFLAPSKLQDVDFHSMGEISILVQALLQQHPNCLDIANLNPLKKFWLSVV
jgi:hypothetical protein